MPFDLACLLLLNVFLVGLCTLFVRSCRRQDGHWRGLTAIYVTTILGINSFFLSCPTSSPGGKEPPPPPPPRQPADADEPPVAPRHAPEAAPPIHHRKTEIGEAAYYEYPTSIMPFHRREGER